MFLKLYMEKLNLFSFEMCKDQKSVLGPEQGCDKHEQIILGYLFLFLNYLNISWRLTNLFI